MKFSSYLHSANGHLPLPLVSYAHYRVVQKDWPKAASLSWYKARFYLAPLTVGFHLQSQDVSFTSGTEGE